MKKMIFAGLVAFAVLFSGLASAVSMNFTGSFRSDASFYNKLGLGLPNKNPTKTFISGRALLNPNLVVDDHFTVRSQWSLLQSPGFAPSCGALGVGQGSYVFGDVNSQALVLCRAWMEWTSDFGVMRAGRMPFSWGYGLLWDAGNGTWDDFQTTYDRLEYRLHLGHVIGAIAYSKDRKQSVLGNENDQEFYTIYLQYDNPEGEVEGGILYEKQARSSGQTNDLQRGNNVTPNPGSPSSNQYALPSAITGTIYPLANKVQFPLTSNVVDVYLKKTSGYFSFGGEVGWHNGTATDYGGNGKPADMNAFGVMANAAYEYHQFKAFLEFLYASGDSNLNNTQFTGFVLLNRNRRPGLILGRELLGQYYGNTVAFGSHVVYGDQDTFSGEYFLRPGVRYDWTPSFSSGLELILAQKALVAPGESKNLGVEVDLGADYAAHKNFELGLQFGYLFPGNGLRVPGATGPFAVRSTASLKF